jgi:hypothetical protein
LIDFLQLADSGEGQDSDQAKNGEPVAAAEAVPRLVPVGLPGGASAEAVAGPAVQRFVDPEEEGLQLPGRPAVGGRQAKAERLLKVSRMPFSTAPLYFG